MSNITLKEQIESFQEVRYPKVTRNDRSYKQTEEFVTQEVTRLLDMYRAMDVLDQRARLIRDCIDFLLRRAHGYNIEGNIGSHYRQVGVSASACDFEHVIPQAKIRDLLIQGKLSVRQAMNPPTCLIDKELHKQLKEEGWASRTPSIWHFWRRYTQVFDASYETFNGQPITDTEAWTLEKHYDFFHIY